MCVGFKIPLYTLMYLQRIETVMNIFRKQMDIPNALAHETVYTIENKNIISLHFVIQ